MTAAPTNRLTVVRVENGRVVCEGRFATADGRGVHSALQPAFLPGEIAHDSEIEVGDVVQGYDDGTWQHQPGGI